jgi:hypothetical protein
MAQTRKRRRRKHRGTQGGRIDRTRRAKPRSRAEAQSQARSKRRTPRSDSPPNWRGATLRGGLMSALFLLILLVLGRPIGMSIAFSAFLLLFYIPMGFYIDRFMWRRRQRMKMKGG